MQTCSSGPICPTGEPRAMSSSGHGDRSKTAGFREIRIDDVECFWWQKIEVQFSLGVCGVCGENCTTEGGGK